MTPPIRRYRPGDAEALGWIFFRAVREGAADFYTPEQRHAWARDTPDAAHWRARLDGGETFVADGPGGPLGFMTLRPGGHLDLAYVLPEAMGRGVADTLHAGVESAAEQRGLAYLTTDASHLSRRFFLKHGWREIAPQTVRRHGVKLLNYRMEKHFCEQLGNLPRHAEIQLLGDSRKAN